MNKFKENINYLISQYEGNLTQYARRIDVSINQLYAYRSGTAEASFDVLLRIAEIEGVTIDWLLGAEKKNIAGFSNEENQLVNDYRKLNENGQKQIKDYLSFIIGKSEYKKEKTISAS